MIRFYTHPYYDANIQSWRDYQALVKGDHDTLTDERYLWMHEFERSGVKGGTALRELREKRSQYANLVAPILRRYVALIFKGGLDVSKVENVFAEGEIDNIDGSGRSLEAYSKRLALDFFKFGRAVSVVDGSADEAASKGEEQAKGLRPYAELISPLDAKDWIIETENESRLGKLNSFRYEYTLVPQRGTLLESPQEFVYTKVYSLSGSRVSCHILKGPTVEDYKNLTKKSDAEFEAVDEFSLGFDELPIVITDHDTPMSEIAPIALLRHNTQSALDNILLFQAHQRLIGTGDLTEEEAAVLNEATITLINGDGNIDVIEPAQPLSLEKRLETITMDLFRVAFSQTRPMPADSRAVEASETLRESKEDFLAVMESSAQAIEDAINEVVIKYGAFRGKEPEDKVTLNLDITIEDVEQTLELIATFMPDIKRSKTWYQETLKWAANQQSPAQLETILEEIETFEPQTAQSNPLRGFLAQENLDDEIDDDAA